MKKYLYLALVAIIACLTSCSNDDIEVGYSVNVKVDPSGVVAPFVPWNAGDLDACPKGYLLRVHIYAYNSEGSLKGSQVVYLNNYGNLANVNLPLSPGKYTFLAVTDVVGGTESKITTEYWKFSGEDNIQNLKVARTNYMGYQRGILGVGKVEYAVGSQGGATMLQPVAAGALIVSHFWQIHYYSTVESYELNVNRNSDYITFDLGGNYLVSTKNENNTYKWRIALVKPADHANYTGVYDYSFMLPANNVGFRFGIFTSSEGYHTDSYTINLNAGDEYFMELDMCNSEQNNEITFACTKIATNSARQTNTILESYGIENWVDGYTKFATSAAMVTDLIDLAGSK